MEWLLAQLVSGWGVIENVAVWANNNVLAAIFFGYLFREFVGWIVKKTPTKYDDIGLEIVEDAITKAWSRVAQKRGK
jgi:hypothetical protein